MSVKDYLNLALEKNAEIDFKREQLALLKSLATKCTTSIMAVTGGKSDCHGKLEGIMIRVTELEKEIEDANLELLHTRQMILDVIFLIRDPTDRFILESVYIDGNDFNFIAGELYYTPGHVRKRHNAIIKAIEKDGKIIDFIDSQNWNADDCK